MSCDSVAAKVCRVDRFLLLFPGGQLYSLLKLELRDLHHSSHFRPLTTNLATQLYSDVALPNFERPRTCCQRKPSNTENAQSS